MNEFLNKLYSYEYFGVYLIIAIIVLVILFFVILFMGKKDQKEREISATKKLQQINNENAFKEDSTIGTVEVTPDVPVKDNLNDTVVLPTLEEAPVISSSESVESSAEANEAPTFEMYNNPTVEQMSSQSVEFNNPGPSNLDTGINEPINSTPILSPIEEKPLVFNESFDNVTSDLNTSLEDTIPLQPISENNNYDSNNQINDSKEVEVPTFNINELMNDVKPVEEKTEIKTESPIFSFDELVKEDEIKKEEPQSNINIPAFDFSSILPTPEKASEEKPTISEPVYKGQEIFSSVYAPAKEEVNENNSNANEDLDIELPALKKEVPSSEENVNKDAEQPKIDIPVLNDYNLDEISGESYTIDNK